MWAVALQETSLKGNGMGKVTDIRFKTKKQLSIDTAFNEMEEAKKKMQQRLLSTEVYKLTTWIESLIGTQNYCLAENQEDPGSLDEHKRQIRKRREVVLLKLSELDNGE